MKITKEIARKFDYRTVQHKNPNPSAPAGAEMAMVATFHKLVLKGYKFQKYLVASSFYAGVLKAKDRLRSVKGLLDLEDESGFMVLGDSLYMYLIENESSGNYIMAKIENNVAVASFIGGNLSNNEDWEHNSAFQEFDDLLNVLLFKKYAETETIFVPAGETQILNDSRYKNQTKTDITVLDCRWFTNIVRTEGFAVSGHFRLQPHGESRAQRKLIWIDEFQKNGYTHQAKVEK